MSNRYLRISSCINGPSAAFNARFEERILQGILDNYVDRPAEDLFESFLEIEVAIEEPAAIAVEPDKNVNITLGAKSLGCGRAKDVQPDNLETAAQLGNLRCEPLHVEHDATSDRRWPAAMPWQQACNPNRLP